MINQLIVVATLEMAHAILLEAALSFLGLGVQPPTPTWGLMISEAKGLMFFDAWLIAIPGIALFMLVLAINLSATACATSRRRRTGHERSRQAIASSPSTGSPSSSRCRRERCNAVQGVSFHVDRGETVCIVGESGCGKSLTALGHHGPAAEPGQAHGAHASGSASRDLARLSEREMSDVRGNRMAMIFQEPMTSLNPAYTIGNQLEEALLRHRRVGRAQARARAVHLLERVGIPAAASRLGPISRTSSRAACASAS